MHVIYGAEIFISRSGPGRQGVSDDYEESAQHVVSSILLTMPFVRFIASVTCK